MADQDVQATAYEIDGKAEALGMHKADRGQEVPAEGTGLRTTATAMTQQQLTRSIQMSLYPFR